MNDYDRVAEVIEYIGAHYQNQPSLKQLAVRTGLSSSHFHRLFKRWAGTTPKHFIQHLTALEAGQLLRNGQTVLDTALGVGLSGPGRLHDLCLNIEAATPGEIRTGGEGWTLQTGWSDTPFGEAFFAISPRGLCKLSFLQGGEDRAHHTQALQVLWPKAALSPNDALACQWASTLFPSENNAPTRQPISAFVTGTRFQVAIWRALIEIPFGEIRPYGEIARQVGLPRGARAVGSAVGSNPIAWLIPCHRVIQASGHPGKYRWGAERKKAMLAWERSISPHFS